MLWELDEYNGISHLQKSFTEASRCVILSEKIQLNGSVFWYEEMGIYNLFSEFGDKKLIQDFVDSTLGIIIDYDKENNTNLLQTLKAYLWNNNSLLHASEQLFTHRNTVKYRIQRITELTGRNFWWCDDTSGVYECFDMSWGKIDICAVRTNEVIQDCY